MDAPTLTETDGVPSDFTIVEPQDDGTLVIVDGQSGVTAAK